MKNVRGLQTSKEIALTSKQKKLYQQVDRILTRVQRSSRSVVKSALREVCDLANTINTSLMRSYEMDQLIRERKEKPSQQRFYL